MKSLGILAVFGAYVYFCTCATVTSGPMMTSHMPHRPREPIEFDSTYFNYDPRSDFLIAKTKDTCYLMALNTAEQKLVHTNSGLRGLEIRMFQLMNYAVHESLKGSDILHLNNMGHFCANQTLVKIHQ